MLERLLVVPDTHAPYHDERAWKLMLKAARQFRPHTIVHIGDLADFYRLSDHSKDPSRLYSFNEEKKIARKCRADLDKLGAREKRFIEGNHEYRLERYLRDKAPELYHEMTTDSALGLSENGWQITPYRSHWRWGRVYFTHDTGNGGKYTTGAALQVYQHSIVIGHHHAMQFQVEGDATGKYRVGAQFGWLGDRNKADYMHNIKAKRNWTLGFGVGYRDSTTNNVYLVPVPMVGYTVCIEGRVVRG